MSTNNVLNIYPTRFFIASPPTPPPGLPPDAFLNPDNTLIPSHQRPELHRHSFYCFFFLIQQINAGTIITRTPKSVNPACASHSGSREGGSPAEEDLSAAALLSFPARHEGGSGRAGSEDTPTS